MININKSNNYLEYFVTEIDSCCKVINLRGANLDGTASATVFGTGGKPSTWFTPGGLVELR